MPGAVVTPQDTQNDQRYSGDDALTASVVIVCVAASSAGLIFGYDNWHHRRRGDYNGAIFLKKFFPISLEKMMAAAC